MSRKIFAFVLILALVMSFSVAAFADGEGGEATGNVAKVGSTEYATIDDAIEAWTNGTTLTLLADVTLSDVIQLSSTEHHILDLGTYTMTAASGKDAIQIVNNGRTSASWTLDIKADATDPGGITATGKAVVKTTGKSGVKDRPIIRFYNGVFNGTNIVYHSGSNGTNCPQFQFHGGVFNGTIYTNRALNQFYGGTFTGSLQMSVDSSAYTLVAGGTFKNLSNLYMSALNSDKFTIGSAKGVYDKEVYIDDNGNYVIAAAQPEGIEAGVAKTPGTNDYLKYSKVATEGQLNYTDVKMALDKNKSAAVTVYVDELDMSGINFTGTIVAPEGKTVTVTNAPEDLKTEGNVIIIKPVAKIGDEGFLTLSAAVEAAEDGDIITVVTDIADVVVEVDENVTITGSATLNNVGINANGADKLTVSGLTFTGNSWINSGTAEKLTVSGVTANVTPSNATYTNSRSAFISLGRSEGQELELTVENCNIVPASGTNPILGWAKITKATITGNTFGSETVYQNSGDSVKFMTIADGAEFTITGNTIYSNYNGIVFAQNTTRDNAYTAIIDNNTFIGGADHIWVEISSGDTCHATINASSTNTVNGEALDITDIKAHTGVIKNWTSYLGVDVVTDANGKVTGGYMAFWTDDAIAYGYEVADGGKVEAIPPVATINSTPYITLTDAIAAAQDGDTITLLKDIELDAGLGISKNITLDGAGYKLTPADSFAAGGNGAVITLADGDTAYSADNKYTIKNLTFEGFTGLTRVVRANFGDIEISNCVFNDNSVSGGVITSAYAELTVTGCTFEGNTVSGAAGFGVIDIGSDVGNGTTVVANITGNEFTDNNVEYAVLFLFSSANASDNYFNGNIHTGSNGNAAAILAGPYSGTAAYTININENAFDDAISKDGAALPAVYVEDHSALGNAFNISNNYWDGGEPVYGSAGTITGLKLDAYYAKYENGVLSDLVKLINGQSARAITFDVTPAEATVVVKDAEGTVVDAETDGSYLLVDGDYTYSVTKNGYYSKNGSFTVDGAAQTVTVKLSPVVIIIPPKPEEPEEPEVPEEPEQPEVPEVCPGDDSCPAHPYDDVITDKWYHDAVDYVVDEGLFKGVAEDEFAPAGEMTRAMFWTVLARMQGVELDESGDVWYEAAMDWAVENGISDGTEAKGDITRQQIITMLWRTVGSPKSEAGLDAFADADSISAWALEAMKWAVEIGIIEGYEDGTLRAANTATRAEVAQLVMNYLEK